jgi:hypothetical protein
MNGSKVSKLAGVGLVLVALGGVGLRAASAAPDRRMESALRHLQEAREELRSARGNAGGHREQALDFTVRAIRQVEQAIDLEGGDRRDRRERR